MKLLFTALVIFAAVSDIRTRTVSDLVCIFIMLTGLPALSLGSVLGAVFASLPFVQGWIFHKNGAGDVTFCAAVGFVLGVRKALVGLEIFSIIYAIFIFGSLVYEKISHKTAPTSCPLIPFLAAGFLPAYFLF